MNNRVTQWTLFRIPSIISYTLPSPFYPDKVIKPTTRQTPVLSGTFSDRAESKRSTAQAINALLKESISIIG